MCEDGLPPGTSSSDYGFWRHNIHSHAREIIMTTRRDRNFAFVSIDQNLNREKRFLTLLFEIVLIRIYIYIYVFKDYDTFFKDSGTNILRINISIRTFT